MKKALVIGLTAAMAVSMSATAPVYAADGIAKEDLKVGIIYIGQVAIRTTWE